MVMKELIHKYIENPLDDKACYDVAIEYYRQGHKASAMGYFLRCAELTEDKLLAYKSLLYSSLALFHQGNRMFATTGCILHAIAILPERPEGWYLYSRTLEVEGKWQESYTTACTALKLCDFSLEPLSELEYPGKYTILFEKAVSAWRIGRNEECREIFSHLHFNVDMDFGHTQLVKNNMEFLNVKRYLHTYYTKEKHEDLRWPFPGSEKIEKNFAQSYQDMFVLTALNGKRNGKYLEIGAAEPFYGNNTALLETQFDWTGYSFEIVDSLVREFMDARKNKIIHTDATKFDYLEFLDQLNEGTDWDYLQIDCDPPEATFEILLKIPFDKYRFATITYEHDYYAEQLGDFRSKSREYLQSKGYVLVAGNIAPDKKRSYEDWWVHPELVDKEIMEKMKSVDNSVLKSEIYMTIKETPYSKHVL
jgi:hypothetical protein